jgi:Homeodomain-like domain
MNHRPPCIHPNGRPTKLTPERRKAFIACLERGLPLKVAAKAVGVSIDAVYDWIRRDKQFAEEVRATDLKSLEANLAYVKDAREDAWQAAAWILERQWPELYARPEVQLNAQLNQINISGAELRVSISPAELALIQTERAQAIEILGREPLPLSNGDMPDDQEA